MADEPLKWSRETNDPREPVKMLETQDFTTKTNQDLFKINCRVIKIPVNLGPLYIILDFYECNETVSIEVN